MARVGLSGLGYGTGAAFAPPAPPLQPAAPVAPPVQQTASALQPTMAQHSPHIVRSVGERARENERILRAHEAAQGGAPSESAPPRPGAAAARPARFRGITYHKRTGRYEAHLWEAGKQIYLGGFSSEERAATAYDLMALLACLPEVRLVAACALVVRYAAESGRPGGSG